MYKGNRLIKQFYYFDSNIFLILSNYFYFWVFIIDKSIVVIFRIINEDNLLDILCFK